MDDGSCPGAVLLAAQVSAEEPPALKTMKDKMSYATGADLVRSFERQGIEVDKDIFLRGVKDGLSGGTLLLSDEEINKLMKLFMGEQKKRYAERKRQKAELKAKQRDNTAIVPPGPDPKPLNRDVPADSAEQGQTWSSQERPCSAVPSPPTNSARHARKPPSGGFRALSGRA